MTQSKLRSEETLRGFLHFPPVNPKGTIMRVPADTHHSYDAVAGLLENVYDPLVDQLGMELPFHWKGKANKLIIDYRKVKRFLRDFFAILQRSNINFHPRIKNLFDSKSKLSMKNVEGLTTFSYQMSVPNPMSLNQGRGDQTYGEINPNQLQKIYDLVKIDKDDIVLDMGSGIGNLVLCTSIMTEAKKVYGIEFLEPLHKFAKQNEMWFKRVLAHVGREARPFEFLKGNFLHEKFHEIITKEADVIIINNYAFSETLQNDIVKVLAKCKNGTRIVTTKQFRMLNRRGDVIKMKPSKKPMAIECKHEKNPHLLNHIFSEFHEISKVDKLIGIDGGFSWCGKKVPLFRTTIKK